MTSRPKKLTVDQLLQNRPGVRDLRSRYMPVETTDLRTFASSHVARGSQWTPPTGGATTGAGRPRICLYSGRSAWGPGPTASCTSGLSMGPCLTHARPVGHVGACRGPLRTIRPSAHVPCSGVQLREHMPCMVSMREARCSSVIVGALARIRAACSRRGRGDQISVEFAQTYPAASRTSGQIHEPTETLGSLCERRTAYASLRVALRRERPIAIAMLRGGGVSRQRISITSLAWGRFHVRAKFSRADLDSRIGVQR